MSFSHTFDRSFSGGIWKQVRWLIAIMIAAYLVLVAFSLFDVLYVSDLEDSRGRWYDIMFLLVDPGMVKDGFVSPFALIIALVGMVVFSGMLISVISNLLERRVEKYKAGETAYTVSNHVVILGFNRSVPSLLNKLHADPATRNSYILLMCDREIERVREWIYSNVETAIEKKLILLKGDLSSMENIERLSLRRKPKKVYVLGEEGAEGHDTGVLDCVRNISRYLTRLCSPSDKKKEEKLECLMQIDSGEVFLLLQQSDFCKTENITNLAVFPFNFNNIWAEKALAVAQFGKGDYSPLDGEGIGPDSRKRVHLIIVGMNDMGRALALNGAHIMHYPNFREGDFSTYSKITFIDTSAIVKGQQFRNRHNTLFQLARWREDFGKWHDPLADNDSRSPYTYLGPKNFIDVEWEFIEGGVYDDKVRNYLHEIAADPDSLTTLALCETDSEMNLGYTMGLAPEVMHRFSMILVRQKEGDVALGLLDRIPGKTSGNVRAFGNMRECYSENLLTDFYGKLVNALYTNGGKDGLDFERDHDKIEEWWEGTSPTDRWSSNYSANMLFVKLRSLGFNEENISEEAINAALDREDVKEWIQKMEHNRWTTEKILLGFTPLTSEEQDEFLPVRGDARATKAMRKDKAAREKKHLDICSNETLLVVDPAVAAYDNNVNATLWEFYSAFRDRTGAR